MSTLPMSIIIPAKNEVENLPQLLRSLRMQTVQPLEIILADAYSTDGTRDVAAREGVVVVDGGLPGVGRNRGAAVAKGDVLLFLDADVVLRDADFLARAYAQFTQRGLTVATCDIAPIDGNRFDDVLHIIFNVYVRATSFFFVHTPGACLFVRADVFHRVRGFDESMSFCEDMDFGRRAARHGKFAILRGLTFYTGMRRMRHDGYRKLIAQYLKAEWYLITHRSIAEGNFDYDLEYTGFQKKSSSTARAARKR